MTIGTGFMIVATTMPMNMMLEKISLGMIETVKIFVLTLLFSLPFGLVVAWGRMSRIKIVKWLVNIYISIMRGTPLMLQVMLKYTVQVLSQCQEDSTKQQICSDTTRHRLL